jgi:hypothetical protein
MEIEGKIGSTRTTEKDRGNKRSKKEIKKRNRIEKGRQGVR